MKHIILALVSLCTSTVFASDLLLENVTVLNPKTQTQQTSFVWISKDKIKSVTKVRPSAFQGETKDLQGKFLLPGFVDMHVHAWGNQGPNNTVQPLGPEVVAMSTLIAGVTAWLDLFADEKQIFEARRRPRAGEFLGSDIFASGPIFTCTGGHGTEYSIPTRVINSPDDAKREITALAAKKPDVIKIAYDNARSMPKIDLPTLEAALRTAKKFGIKTVVHIGTWENAMEAAVAGADAITHLYEQPIPDQLVRLLKRHQVALIPTMSIQSELWLFKQNPKLLDAPLLAKMISPELLAAYRNPADQLTQYLTAWQQASATAHQSTMRKLASAGIQVLTGTDAGNIGVIQGFSVHREMKYMVDHGFSEWQALASATVLPGQFLKQSYGVEAGDMANLVVLNTSPLENILNTQDIFSVYLRGRLFQPLISGRN